VDDGEPQQLEALTVVVALGPYTGGGMHIAPGAKLDDALFDVVTIRAMSSGELAINLPKIYAGTHVTHPSVALTRGQSVCIETADAPGLELDGEVVGRGSAEFRILPHSIPVWVPRP
jgi:diacylglycerol kinase (ATP)